MTPDLTVEKNKPIGKDQKDFMDAYDKYVDQIYRFIYFKVGSKEEAEDLSSAVFLKTWGYIREHSIKNSKTLKSLFYKIARNLIIDHYRKNSKQDSVPLSGQELEIDLPDENQNIIKKTEENWDLSVVETRLPQLKDEYREVIVMRYINELSISEIADILGKPKGSVRVLVFRAINALKELVNEKKV